MVNVFEKDDLIKLLKDKKKHDVGDVKDVLPFLTKKTGAIKEKFNKVLGEYVRNICSIEIDKKAMMNEEFSVLSDSDNQNNGFSEYIATKVDFNNDDDMFDFVRFLNEYLFNEEDIKLIHPYLFNFITDDNNKNEFGKYGKFMNDVLILNEEEFKEIFNNKEMEDILTELVLTHLDITKEKKKTTNNYTALLPALTKLYQEDIFYLSKHKDYFLTSFPLLTHYYVFMYACQLVIKFQQFKDADYSVLTPFYFSLEWESLSRRRKAANSVDSYKFIKENHKNLFPHIHTLSLLSHNSYNRVKAEGEKKLTFMTYSDLYKICREGLVDQDQLFVDIKEFMTEYKEWAGISYEDHSQNLEEALRSLFESLKEGTSSTVAKKFGANIDDLGANQFIKSRGSLGNVLNLKHDFLLLLTAVSVKDQRIPLNDLFIEFEKRGIVLDRYTKREVINLFNNLNIIDKKSDSGDAQYVKPIL